MQKQAEGNAALGMVMETPEEAKERAEAAVAELHNIASYWEQMWKAVPFPLVKPEDVAAFEKCGINNLLTLVAMYKIWFPTVCNKERSRA
jgi:hypothetical protein